MPDSIIIISTFFLKFQFPTENLRGKWVKSFDCDIKISFILSNMAKGTLKAGCIEASTPTSKHGSFDYLPFQAKPYRLFIEPK